MRRFLILIPLALAACRGGASSPEDAAQALIKAAAAGDTEGVKKAMLSADVLASVLSCPADKKAEMEKDLTEEAEKKAKAMVEQLSASGDTKVSIEVVGRDTSSDKEETKKVGDKINDCEVKKEMRSVRTRLKLRMTETKDGNTKTDEDTEAVRFINVGSRWYVVDF